MKMNRAPFAKTHRLTGPMETPVRCRIRTTTAAGTFLLLAISSMLFAPAFQGDTWGGPDAVSVRSPSGNFIAEVIPGSGGFDYDRALTNLEQNASAVVSMRREGGITKVVWEGKLVNPIAPVTVYVSDAGYLVTMDNWHQYGYGSVVVFYDPKGRLLRHWRLEELYQPEERRSLIRSVSSIHWKAGQAHFGTGAETNTFIVPALIKTFRFALTNGTLLSTSATITNAAGRAANRSQPIRVVTNQTSSAAGSRR